MSRRIYFDTRKAAEAEQAKRNDRTVSVRRVPYGRHKGKFVVCSYLGFINEIYNI